MGHLFVVQADLTRLAVDHVIIPTDDQANVHEGFLRAIKAPTGPATYRSLTPAYRHVVLEGGTTGPGPWRAPATDGGPQPWLLDSTPPAAVTEPLSTPEGAGDDDPAMDSLMARIAQAVAHIAAEPLSDGHRPRIGLTLLGLKEGGYARHYDRVVLRTLETLYAACVGAQAPDIVLVLRSRADYAAVQHLRRTQPGVGPTTDQEWTAPATQAIQLAERATRGQLVLFLGAGASSGAGLADWSGLLEEHAVRVGLQVDLKRFKALDPRDAALLIASAHPDGPDAIRTEIAKSFDLDRYSLTHALLASLKVDQALTTNYDTLYESASRDTEASEERQIRVLPREPYIAGRPWLMKIHGDARAPESIVLSRYDYIDFDARSVPMASVLQSAMMTSHLLFVGYSMKDENVVRLARQVIRFREQHLGRSHTPGPGAVGTVLTPTVDKVKQKLWSGVLDYVALPTSPGESAGDLKDPRDLDLLKFLDILGMHACQDAGYFMVGKYWELLSDADRALIEPLRALQSVVAAEGASSAAATTVRALLASLGGESSGPAAA